MGKAILKTASNELFRRGPDECFASLEELYGHCWKEREDSRDLWIPSKEFCLTSDLTLTLGDNPDARLNDWSFTQLCRMAKVNKETVNRFSPKTASKALEETLTFGSKPLQVLAKTEDVRAVHGVAYTRLWNADLLNVVRESASDFTPPQTAFNGQGTGLYCGEQDMFCFLIDPLGWAEIEGEAFAPGFFVWNSEVGRRSLGVQTFWFQAVCQNHIVWDAVEIVDFSRKHTANVNDGLLEIRRIIEQLVAKRDARCDSFVRVMRKAMIERLGEDAEQVAKVLLREGIPANIAHKALELAQGQGRFTIFSLVDALTRLTQECRFAGDRVEVDAKVAGLLSLAV